MRPLASPASIPEKYLCKGCRRRYRQGSRFCRRCEQDVQTTLERDRQRLERQRAADQKLQRREVLPREPREIVVDGQVFEVKFDGSI